MKTAPTDRKSTYVMYVYDRFVMNPQRSNWVTWCSFACKLDAASRVTWLCYWATPLLRPKIPF